MPRSKKTVKDKLDEALNLANTELEVKNKPKVEVLPPATKPLLMPSRPEQYNPQSEEDYEYARSMYYNLSQKGMEALDGLLDIAAEGEQPRAYEVAAVLIKTVAEVTSALTILQEKMRILRGMEAPAIANQQLAPSGDTNNFIFTGNSKDLLKMVNEAREVRKTLKDK